MPSSDDEIEIDDLDDLDPDDRALFDISGYSVDMKQNTRKRMVALVFHGPEHWDWNLMRLYLAMRDYVAKIEAEMGVMPEPVDEQ